MCDNRWVSTTQELARPATSTDVAKLAGVSRGTVSRILNGDDGPFPVATRLRVFDAATKLNYRPSGAARSLRKGQSDTIVVLSPDTRFGSHLQDSVDEVAAQTRPYGGNVVVPVASATSQVTIDALLRLRPFVVLNFGVLTTADAAILTQRGIIVVPNVTDSTVVASDPGIGRLQAETLRRNGERPIWYAETTGDRPEPFSRERLDALQAYCAEKELEPPHTVPVTLDLEGGKRAIGQMFARRDHALVACYNDEVALTLLAGARELGIAVPGELAVIGVDDTVAGQLWSPRLTTVHVNMRNFIATLIAELREQLEGSAAEPNDPLPSMFTLIEGETA